MDIKQLQIDAVNAIKMHFYPVYHFGKAGDNTNNVNTQFLVISLPIAQC